MGFQFAKKRDDRPSLDWWLEPAREETVKQKTSEEFSRKLDELLKLPPILIELTRPEGKKYIPGPQDMISEHSRLDIVWGDLPDMQSELKLWIPEDLEHLISPSKESLSRIDGIA